ncbi:hypothetical protein PF66_01359 [Pseudomonas asplenii]|uniref:Uncharacterized protein n=1 Tax=Pseudomonas asplenii TaxID=53407 RepID=A0A0M9GI25_9PSED|nr:hypothetical protein [Pseudomonas fuscovaginae]KPA91779.1 hypothetical protein PF66_01359 [Pseudomonas fuscovaginae]
MSGREDSVAKTFHRQLFRACNAIGALDLSIPLCGTDRHFNADEMFAANDRFLLIEFKSSRYNLGAEKNKHSACVLCTGLIVSREARLLHRACHFAMWGKKQLNAGLHIQGGVYQDLVCNRNRLPLCETLAFAEIDPKADKTTVFEGAALAHALAQEKAGLPADEFAPYLQWLLSLRGGESRQQKFPVVVFGISMLGPVESYAFNSFHDLAGWAKLGIVPEPTDEPDEDNWPSGPSI